jgi:hypothetical protein
MARDDRRPRGDEHFARARPHLLARGERHGMAKLTTRQVAAIRSRYARANVTMTELAADYDCSQSLVNKIIHCQIWRHVAVGDRGLGPAKYSTVSRGGPLVTMRPYLDDL